MSLIVGLLVLTFLLWIGFHLTGAVLGVVLWLLIRLPLAALFFVLGVVCCCTFILIPVGIWFFKVALQMLIPGCLV